MKLRILKAGWQQGNGGVQVNISEQELKNIAAAYDVSRYKAPVIIYPPQLADPAYGGVISLSCEGEDLFAELALIDPQFYDSVHRKPYSKITVGFFPPSALANPRPGSFYLKHVAFHGVQPPRLEALEAFPRSFSTTEFADAFHGKKSVTTDFAPQSTVPWDLARHV